MTQRQRDAVTRRISNASHPSISQSQRPRVLLSLPLLLLAAILTFMPVETVMSYNKTVSELAATEPDEDWDQDGLTNSEEAAYATNPALNDTDADQTFDGEDGWAGGTDIQFEALVAPPRLSERRYVAIDLGTDWGVAQVNNRGHVYGSRSPGRYYFWDAGELTILPDQVDGLGAYFSDMNNNGEIIGNIEWDPFNEIFPRIAKWKKGDGVSMINVPAIQGASYFNANFYMRSINDNGVSVGTQYEVGQVPFGEEDYWNYDAWGFVRIEGASFTRSAFTCIGTTTDPGQYPLGFTSSGRLIKPSIIQNDGRIGGEYWDVEEEGGYQTLPTGGIIIDTDGTPHLLPGTYSISSLTEQGHITGANSSGGVIGVRKDGSYHLKPFGYGRLSNQMEILQTESIWRNFKQFFLTDLITGDDYKNPYAIDGSENGLILSWAEKKSDDVWHLLLLLPFELAIDSDNNNGFDPPRRTQAEREARGELGNDEKPGKVILVNDGDLDSDGIPDYADGYNLDDGIAEDNTSENVRFVPVILHLTAFDWQNAKVKFQYPASDPAQVTASADNPCVLPTEGKIRLWMKDGGEERNKDPLDEEGDFIKPDTEYTMEQLGLSQGENEVTLYVEAVKLSDQTADIEIKVEFDPSGTMGFDKVTDAVRLTATRVEILARGANETNFSVSDRLVASTLQLEPGDEQVTLDPFLLAAPIGGGTGDAVETQNGYSLSSQSTGIGGTADQFEMVYYVDNGDFDIHAKLASFSDTVAASKAGLMVRDKAGEGAVFGMVAVNGSNNYIFEYRDESGEASQTISGGTAAANPWLRLTRQGGTVRAYTSADGQSWQQIGNGAALSFAPDSLVGMCLTSGSATTTSTAEFTNVDLPLSSTSLTISDEITPGSYATYKIRIHDPRQSGIDNFKIDDQEVSLSRTGNYYESEEFICTIDGERLDVEGIPEKVIYLRSEPPMGEYNPFWPFKSDPKPLPGPAGYRVVADLIDKSVKEMEANPSSWTATNDGSFGTEVHKRVSSKLQNKSGWLADVYVENGTNRILSIGHSPGSTAGTTQIDLLHLQSGYKPKVGEVLDSSKVENLFEIKTSISGKIAPDQKARLKAVMGGGKIVVAKSPKRWTMASGWESNKRFGAGFKFLSLVGVGSAVYAILNYDDQDEQLGALIAEGKQINGISDPEWKKASTIVWMGNVRNWLSQFFPDSTVVDLAIVGVIYIKVLPGEEFQPD